MNIYYIDLSNFLEKQQNKLLKFIEEPAMNTFICIGTISEACALPTVLNRCLKYIFEPYSVEELRQIKFINKDYKIPNQAENSSNSNSSGSFLDIIRF